MTEIVAATTNLEPSASPSPKWPVSFYCIAATSFAGMIVSFFRWPLINWLSVFVEPFVEIGVWVLFLSACIGTMVTAIRGKRFSNLRRFGPLVMAILFISVFLFVPFAWMESNLDFRLHMHQRTEAAKRLLAQSPAESQSDQTDEFVKLYPNEKNLSDGGEVMVNRTARMVFFFTFSGILEHFSGFVYSANDRPPTDRDFEGEADLVETERLAPNWYWAASR